MAQTRKDLRGRVLRKGESQRRSDERYVYTYTDPLGRRKYVYAQDLVTLREKEAQLLKDQMDGLDIYVAGKATVNFVFDRYMSLKNNLKPTTKSNYLYMYDRFVRDTFGKRNIAEIKYSDVVQFYNYLVEKQELQINTLETVHTLLHPTFQLAVRDDIIRKNPSDGVMAELKKNLGMKTGVRHALTIPQQRAFIEYIATHPIYYHWWPIFTVFLGTGCRIGEMLKKFPTMKTLGAEKNAANNAAQAAAPAKCCPEEGISCCVEEEKIDFSKVQIEPLFADSVDFETFSKSDFRAVKVLACEAVPKSKKLLKFTLNDGTGTERTILSGIHAYYEPEELVGKTLLAITNLPPRPMMGIESCGMLISAVHTEEGEEKLHLLMLDNHIPAGAKMY